QKSGLPICLECLGTGARNKSGQPEELTRCVECGACVHPSCLGPAHADLITVLSARGHVWKCEDCSLCAKCNTATEQVTKHGHSNSIEINSGTFCLVTNLSGD
ncbi:hypothetical protein AAG570_002580, partial [Ranatra chinensis]